MPSLLIKLAISSVTPDNITRVRERLLDNMAFAEYIVLGKNDSLPNDFDGRSVLKYVTNFSRLVVVKLTMPNGMLWAEEFLRRSCSPFLEYIVITGIEARRGHPALLHAHAIADAMDRSHRFNMLDEVHPPIRWVFAADPGSPYNLSAAKETERRLARELFRRMGFRHRIGFDSDKKHPQLAYTKAENGESIHSLLGKCGWTVRFSSGKDNGEPLTYDEIDDRRHYWSWRPGFVPNIAEA